MRTIETTRELIGLLQDNLEKLEILKGYAKEDKYYQDLLDQKVKMGWLIKQGQEYKLQGGLTNTTRIKLNNWLHKHI